MCVQLALRMKLVALEQIDRKKDELPEAFVEARAPRPRMRSTEIHFTVPLNGVTRPRLQAKVGDGDASGASHRSTGGTGAQ